MKICQSVINSSTGRSNKIASCLQPMLLEPEIYSDLCLLQGYYSHYLKGHFKWMQEATDLSGVPGFQSHNTLPRYFLLQDQLSTMKSTILSDHPAFHHFRSSLQLLSPDSVTTQVNKVNTFMTVATESCHKHFKRWMSKDLLPAALLSEKPLAKIVARAMLRQHRFEALENREYASTVHKLMRCSIFGSSTTL